MVQKNIFDLSGKVALITGGSHGLGQAMCEAMAEFGADIACNYFSSKEGSEKVIDYAKKLGRRAIAIQADVSKPDEIDHMVNKTVAELGTIDILFCNAARLPPKFVRIHEMPIDWWDSCMELNLRGVFLCMRATIPVMLKQRGGSIITISSTNALVAGVEGHAMVPMAPYHASKAGILGLTREAAVEYAKDEIRVNCIIPGGHITHIGIGKDSGILSLEEYEKFNMYMSRFIPMGRLGEPREIKGLAIYLASDASSYVTGQTFVQDGGFIA